MKNAIARQDNPMRSHRGLELGRRQDRAQLQLHHKRRRKQLQLSGSSLAEDYLPELLQPLRRGHPEHAHVTRQPMHIAQALRMRQLWCEHLLERAEWHNAPFTQLGKQPAKTRGDESVLRRTV